VAGQGPPGGQGHPPTSFICDHRPWNPSTPAGVGGSRPARARPRRAGPGPLGPAARNPACSWTSRRRASDAAAERRVRPACSSGWWQGPRPRDPSMVSTTLKPGAHDLASGIHVPRLRPAPHGRHARAGPHQRGGCGRPLPWFRRVPPLGRYPVQEPRSTTGAGPTTFWTTVKRRPRALPGRVDAAQTGGWVRRMPSEPGPFRWTFVDMGVIHPGGPPWSRPRFDDDRLWGVF